MAPRQTALCFAVASGVVSCASSPPPRTATSEEMAKLYPELGVQIGKAEPPPYCTGVGTVRAQGSAGYEALRTRAAALRANYVVIDALTPAFEWYGRAFVCPAVPPASSPATAQATSPCEPDCSPGYVCLRGACVSACNPQCPASQKCGADRVCHAER